MRSKEIENGTARSFERTHAWIKFDRLNLTEISHKFWMMIGEANSECQHLANSALPPEISAEMYKVYLVKGVQATTSIEGNTLSEEQVSKELEGKLELPESQEYQRIEVKNVLKACQEIVSAVVQNKPLRLTPDLVRHFNSLVLEGLETRDGETAAGEFRTYSVGVGTYKAPPWEDCPFLIERLCEWLNGPQFVTEDDDLKFLFAFLKAVVAHLYIAWIHPFADGNGRTARLIEFQLLTHCNFVPLPAAHVLSNYYNKTRQLYYRELDRSHRATDGLHSFLFYSLRGFVEGLREQLAYVGAHQLEITWRDFVHERFRGEHSASGSRRKYLVLDMPKNPIGRKLLKEVSPRVAAAYAGTGDKTLSRDINALRQMKLIVRTSEGYLAARHTILAFLPPMGSAPHSR